MTTGSIGIIIMVFAIGIFILYYVVAPYNLLGIGVITLLVYWILNSIRNSNHMPPAENY